MRGGLGYVVASAGTSGGGGMESGGAAGGGVDRDPAIIVVGCGGGGAADGRDEGGGGELARIVIGCGAIGWGEDDGAFAIEAPTTTAIEETGFEGGGSEGGGTSSGSAASVTASGCPSISSRCGFTTARTDSTSDVIARGFGAREGRGTTGRIDGRFLPSFDASEAVDMEFSRDRA
jgi:hypothetical protein